MRFARPDFRGQGGRSDRIAGEVRFKGRDRYLRRPIRLRQPPLVGPLSISETCEPAVCKVRSAGQPYRQKCRHFYALATDASGPVCILGGDDIVRRLTNAFRFAQRENFRLLLIDQKEASFGILDIDRRVDAVEERLYPVAVARFSRLSVLASDAKPQTLMP